MFPSLVVPPLAARESYLYTFKLDRNAALHRRVIIARRRREAEDSLRKCSDLLPDDDKFDTTPILTVEPQAQECLGIEASTCADEEADSVSATVSPIPSPSSSPIPLPTTPSTSLPPTTKPKPKRHRQDRLDPYHKLQASIEAAGRRGGHAFSVNLGIGREGALLNSDDPARRLSLEINRALRQTLGHVIPYNFMLELTPDSDGYDRLHAHGSFVPGHERLDAIRDALTRAAGQALSTLGGKRQLDTRPIFNAVGWASYVTKARRWGKARPAGRHAFVNRLLSQMARQDYAQFGLDSDIVFARNRRKKVAEMSEIIRAPVYML